jgi:tetratricopeptide (TPR) repeat protein
MKNSLYLSILAAICATLDGGCNKKHPSDSEAANPTPQSAAVVKAENTPDSDTTSSQASAYLDHALELKKKNDYTGALGELEKGIKLAPNNTDLLNALAWLLATCPDKTVRDGKNALDYANKASDLKPNDPNIEETLAAAYAETGDFKEAQKWATDALTSTTNESDRNELQRELDEYKQGIPYANKSETAQAAPSNPGSVSLPEKDRPTNPEDNKDGSVAHSSLRRNVHLDRALFLKRNNDYPGAMRELEKGLTMAPNKTELLNALAWLLATCPDQSLRNGNKALEFARKASEQATPNNPNIMETLAAAYAESGDFQQAQKWATEALNSTTNESDRKVVQGEIDGYKQGKPYTK